MLADHFFDITQINGKCGYHTQMLMRLQVFTLRFHFISNSETWRRRLDISALLPAPWWRQASPRDYLRLHQRICWPVSSQMKMIFENFEL